VATDNCIQLIIAATQRTQRTQHLSSRFPLTSPPNITRSIKSTSLNHPLPRSTHSRHDGDHRSPNKGPFDRLDNHLRRSRPTRPLLFLEARQARLPRLVLHPTLLPCSNCRKRRDSSRNRLKYRRRNWHARSPKCRALTTASWSPRDVT
jgi:hypothetical protein